MPIELVEMENRFLFLLQAILHNEKHDDLLMEKLELIESSLEMLMVMPMEMLMVMPMVIIIMEMLLVENLELIMIMIVFAFVFVIVGL